MSNMSLPSWPNPHHPKPYFGVKEHCIATITGASAAFVQVLLLFIFALRAVSV